MSLVRLVRESIKPKILRQPKSVFLNEGAIAAFRITARGSALQYKWQYYDDAFNKWYSVTAKDALGLGSDTLKLPARISRNAVQYRCEVTGNGFVITSKPATLYVLELELFLRAMRQKAKSIGMSNTVITSPTGLDRKTMSTASDLLNMVFAAYKAGSFKQIWGVLKR